MERVADFISVQGPGCTALCMINLLLKKILPFKDELDSEQWLDPEIAKLNTVAHIGTNSKVYATSIFAHCLQKLGRGCLGIWVVCSHLGWKLGDSTLARALKCRC